MIDGIPVLNIGAGGLVTLFVVLFFTGRIVPWRIYLAMKEDRDTWRAAAEELRQQNTELITDKDLSVELLRALRAYAAAKRGEEP